MSYVDHISIDDVQYDIRDADAVSFEQEQTLTDAQKEQARANIGAGSEADVVELKSALDVVNDSVIGIFNGKYSKPVLWLAWENGGISAGGVENNNAFSIRSSGFVMFDNPNIWVQAQNGENIRLTTFKYQSDGSFVSSGSLIGLRERKRIVIDTNCKYRFVLYDMTTTTRPDADTFTVRYEYKDFTYVPDIVQNAINDSATTINRKKADVSDFVTRRALVTIIDDDGYTDFYNRLFDENGVYLLHAPVCTAMEALKMGSSNFMTAEQLRTVEASGCEILGHGYIPLAPKVRNPESDPITIAEAEADVVANLEAFHAAGFNPVGYVYPSGATNVEVREMLAKYYEYAMTTIRHLSSASPYYDRLYNFNCIPHYAINRVSLFTTNETLKAWSDISAIVADCVANNGWLVLYMHLHKDTGLTATAATINAIIDNIIDSGADIVTATEAFDIFRNAWQTGDYLGPWNTFGSWGIEYETHTANDAGCAVNMIGQWDLPSSKQI